MPRHTNDQGIPKVYSPYGRAKDDLIQDLGDYCSYCERQGYHSALDVEHVQPKGLPQYAHLEEEWDNFLLGCKNCNPIKGNKDVVFNVIFLPHRNNSFYPYEYLQGGVIQIKNSLSQPDRNKAQNLIDLVGLDRLPGDPGHSINDKRWQERMNTYNLAEKYLDKYERNEANEEIIVDLAKAKGFWSVWMWVFDAHTAVKNQLVSKFPGTCERCFDAQANPVKRNGAEI